MLNEERVKLMTQMAAYENALGQDDLKISSYYRKDYASLNTLISVLWITVGYGILVGLILVSNLEAFMKNLTMTKMVWTGGTIVGVYLVLVIIYCVAVSDLYKRRHNKAKQRVKRYYRDLARLGKLYVKEK